MRLRVYRGGCSFGTGTFAPDSPELTLIAYRACPGHDKPLDAEPAIRQGYGMNNAYFFGYGSLVNRATHIYTPAFTGSVRGWRREWRHMPARPVAILTAVRDPMSVIQGLVAPVPEGDWAALDLREAAYRRHLLGDTISHGLPGAKDIQIYAVPSEDAAPPTVRNPILLSYLDVVVQGYLQVYGLQGVAEFFATTTGWDAPVLNDRTAPIYPRHQPLSAEEIALVDDHLAKVGARIVVET